MPGPSSSASLSSGGFSIRDFISSARLTTLEAKSPDSLVAMTLLTSISKSLTTMIRSWASSIASR